jgi:hypothetical protein
MFEFKDGDYRYKFVFKSATDDYGIRIEITRYTLDNDKFDFTYEGPYQLMAIPKSLRDECDRLLKLKAFW